MKTEDIKNSADLVQYIVENEETIFIRAEINGKWGSHSLSELPRDKRAIAMRRFVEEKKIPVRVI